MPFGADLALGAISPIASIGAAALQRNWALKDWHRQNEYNSPKQQINRNKQAGLPLAAMFSQGGSTSSDVRATQVDPSLGTARGIEAFQSNRLQRKQLQLMDEQIGEAEANKVIAQVAANEATGKDFYYRSPKFDEKGNLIVGNRQQDSLALSMREQEAKTKTSEIMAKFGEAKTIADIDHIKQTIKLGVQQHEWNEIKQYLDKWIKNKLDNNGLNALEAIIYKFLLRAN